MRVTGFPIVIIRQFERGIVEEFGKFKRFVEGKAKAIELVSAAAEKYFIGNAKMLKMLEVTENSLKSNSKIVVTDKGITPSIIIGEITGITGY